MKKFLLFALLLLSGSLFAQQKITLLFAEKEGQPAVGVAFDLSLCNVTYHLVTDQQGSVTQPLSASDTCAEMRVRVASSFYEPLDTTVRLDDLGQRYLFRLTPVSILVEDVKVSAFQPISKENAREQVFKFNPKAVIPSTKMDVALKLVPGLQVSMGSIRMVGESKDMKILIDGVEASSDELKHLEASSISKIEIRPLSIDNDKYGGELNIIRKPSPPSFYGACSTSVGVLSFYSSVFPSFAVRTKRVEVRGSGGYYQSNQRFESQNTLSDEDGRVVSDYRTESRSEVKQYYADVTLNLLLAEKLKSSFSYNLFGYDGDARRVVFLNSQKPKDIKDWGSHNQHVVNALLRYDVTKQFKLRAQGFFYRFQDANYVLDDASSSYLVGMLSYGGRLSAAYDEVRFWSMTHYFEAGYRFSQRHMNLEISRTRYDLHRIYISDYIEFPYSLSLYLILKEDLDRYVDKNWSNSSSSFLPAVTFQYRNRQVGNFRLTYERGVGRPGVDYLNPRIVTLLSNGLQTEGNPDLKSQTQDRFSLSYSRQIAMSYLSLYTRYTRLNDIIDAIYLKDVNRQRYENAGQGQFASVGFSYSLPLLEGKLNFNLSLSATYNIYSLKPEFASRSISLGNKGWGGRGYLDIMYSAPHDFLINLSVNYSPVDLNFNTTAYKGPSLFLQVKKSFSEGRYELGFDYYPMFNWGETTRTEYKLRGYKRETYTHHHMENVSITLSVNFGKQFRPRSYGEDLSEDDIVSDKAR